MNSPQNVGPSDSYIKVSPYQGETSICWITWKLHHKCAMMCAISLSRNVMLSPSSTSFQITNKAIFSKRLDGMFSQGLGIKSSSLVYTMVWGYTWGRWENDQWKIGNNLMKNFISTLAIYFALLLITLTIMLISMQVHRDLWIWWSSLGIKC